MNFLDKRILIILGITLVFFIFYYILQLIGLYERSVEGFFSQAGLPNQDECKKANCSWDGGDDGECNLPDGMKWSNTKNVCTKELNFEGNTTPEDCKKSNCVWKDYACYTPDGKIC